MGAKDPDLFAYMRLAPASAAIGRCQAGEVNSDPFRRRRQMTTSSAEVRHSEQDFRHTQAIGMLLGRTNTNGFATKGEWTQLLRPFSAPQRGPDQSGDDKGCNDAEYLPRLHGSVPFARGS